jgi:hypothetical protein
MSGVFFDAITYNLKVVVYHRGFNVKSICAFTIDLEDEIVELDKNEYDQTMMKKRKHFARHSNSSNCIK